MEMTQRELNWHMGLGTGFTLLGIYLLVYHYPSHVTGVIGSAFFGIGVGFICRK